MAARILAVGLYGFLELLRSRVYLNLLVAGVCVCVTSLAFDQLAAGEGERILVDVGLAFISLVTAALAGTTAIVAVTREIETKQIHLVLSRPIQRWELVVGRFVTVALLVLASNALLGLVLTGMGLGLSTPEPWRMWLAVLFSSFEGFIIAAVAIFFGVGSSSTMSAVFTITIFVLGRLTLALDALLEAGKFQGPLEMLLEGAYAVLPHFWAFDLTTWARGETSVDAGELVGVVAYGLLYTGALLAFASLRLQRRDLL